MQDEQEFLRAAQAALDGLKHHLIAREQPPKSGFEIEEHGGVLNVLFDDPGNRFVITPNATVRQISVSAPSTNFKLDLDSRMEEFIFSNTGETLIALVDRLISEYHAV